MMLMPMLGEELEQHRTKIVLEIEEFNSRIGGTPSGQKKELRELESQRDVKRTILRAVDAEFERRGLEPRNA